MSKINVNNNNSTKKVDKPKKEFDKKKYRQQKYSHKFKVNSWMNRRKNTLLRDLYKNSETNKTIYNEKNNTHRDMDGKRNAISVAKLEFKRRQEEKQKRIDESLRIKSERQEALKRYKEKKSEVYKKLSQKTKKGQPLMKSRLELLLKKIEESN